MLPLSLFECLSSKLYFSSVRCVDWIVRSFVRSPTTLMDVCACAHTLGRPSCCIIVNRRRRWSSEGRWERRDSSYWKKWLEETPMMAKKNKLQRRRDLHLTKIGIVAIAVYCSSSFSLSLSFLRQWLYCSTYTCLAFSLYRENGRIWREWWQKRIDGGNHVIDFSLPLSARSNRDTDFTRHIAVCMCRCRVEKKSCSNCCYDTAHEWGFLSVSGLDLLRPEWLLFFSSLIIDRSKRVNQDNCSGESETRRTSLVRSGHNEIYITIILFYSASSTDQIRAV